MTLSTIKEMYSTLESKVINTYGTISKADMKEFILWLQDDQELKETGYNFEGLQEFPFDIDEIIEEYLEQSYFVN
jgi:hypothetical protein